MYFALSWSKAAEEMKAYYSGSQEGSTQETLGIWAGDLASTTTLISSQSTTPDQTWDGYIAHIAVWDSVLSPADIADLAVIP